MNNGQLRRAACSLVVLLLYSTMTSCGGGIDESTTPAPEAAPQCPPGVDQVTDVAQLTDADRFNGRIEPDVGTLPKERALSGDPGALGPYTYEATAVSVPRPAGDEGTCAGTIYAPVNAPSPAPLVIVMPGYGVTHAGYVRYSTTFASYGFVVLGLDTGEGGLGTNSDHRKEAKRTVAAIDWMLTDGPQASRIDGTKIAVAGHSKGGKVGFWAAALDPRIDLVIGWDPSNAGGPPCFIDPIGCNSQPAAPNCNTLENAGRGVIHLMHAESYILGVPPDRLSNPDPAHNSLNFYRGAPSPATFLPLKGGHADFVIGNPKMISLAVRASSGVLLSRLMGIRVSAAYQPGGVSFDPDGLLNPPVRAK